MTRGLTLYAWIVLDQLEAALRVVLLVLCIAIFASVLSGCVTVAVGSSDAKESWPNATYTVKDAEWTLVEDADHVRTYHHKQLSAVLGVSTACDSGLRDQSLDNLQSSVLPPFRKREVVTQRVLEAKELPSNYRGSSIRLKGELDGQKTDLMAVTLKSADCVHDFILTGPNLPDELQSQVLYAASTLREVQAH